MPLEHCRSQHAVRYYTQVSVPGRNGRAVKLKLAGQGQRPFCARRLPATASTASLRGRRLRVLVLHRSRVP